MTQLPDQEPSSDRSVARIRKKRQKHRGILHFLSLLLEPFNDKLHHTRSRHRHKVYDVDDEPNNLNNHKLLHSVRKEKRSSRFKYYGDSQEESIFTSTKHLPKASPKNSKLVRKEKRSSLMSYGNSREIDSPLTKEHLHTNQEPTHTHRQKKRAKRQSLPMVGHTKPLKMDLSRFINLQAWQANLKRMLMSPFAWLAIALGIYLIITIIKLPAVSQFLINRESIDSYFKNDCSSDWFCHKNY